MTTDDLSVTADVHWYLWAPETAAAHDEIVSAVADFEAPDTNADRYDETWLKRDALDAYPRILTYIAIRGGLVEGFYSLMKTQVAVTEPRRSLFSRTSGRDQLRQATLITAIARRREGRLSGRDLLIHAIGTALDDPQSVALLVEPRNDRVAAMWGQNGFRQVGGGETGRLLWLPISVPTEDKGFG